ncbi:MAG: metallophosphoesterase family protein [Thermogutta sp.]
MKERTIAIGDIHGYDVALRAILEKICPTQRDTIITLGDYVDRGPGSREVIEGLIELQNHTHLVPILGNHDEMMLSIWEGSHEFFDDWLHYGGAATLASYNTATLENIPKEHILFLQQCRVFFETDHHLFVHANYEETSPLSEQDTFTLRWKSLRQRLPGPHISGKKAIVGHTAQRNFEIFDVGYLLCIDTCCYGGGWLTALDVVSGHVWQADADGRTREWVLESVKNLK